MAIARLTGQDATGISAATGTVSATYPGATTVNNLLISVVGSRSDNNSLAITGWTQAVYVDASGSNEMAIFFKIAAGTETTITANGGNVANMRIFITEYSGLITASVLDKTVTGNLNFISPVNKIGSLVGTTALNELVLAAVFTQGTTNLVSWSNGFTGIATVGGGTDNLYVAELIAGSMGDFATILTLDTAATAGDVMASFKGPDLRYSNVSWIKQ